MNPPIKIARQDKEQLIAEIEEYVQLELGQQIGNIAAEGLFDRVLALALPYVYNQAIRDAKDLITQEFTRLDEEMSVLLRPISHRR